MVPLLTSVYAMPPFETEALGPLELEVMRIVWALPDASVRDVMDHLERPLAYTTIMTTLDRLYKKGLLERKRHERAFLYTSRQTQAQWESQRAGGVLAGFFASGNSSRDLFASYLVDAVEQHDPAMLDMLEEKIRSKRQELAKGSKK